MTKRTIRLALALAFGLSAMNTQAAVTLTFSDGTASAAAAGACSRIGWTAGAEFRLCNTSGIALGNGGFKNAFNGGETYTFNDAGQMTAVSGTPLNPGAGTGGAAPIAGTNPTMQQDPLPPWGFGPFNILAPTTTSLAGAAYGPGLFLGGAPVNGTTTLMHFNVLELQAFGSHFPLGLDLGTGIDFTGTISGASTVGNVTTFTFDLFASDLIDVSEDPTGCCMSGYTAQWHLQGTGVHTAVPVPAAVWLLGSGMVALVGVARRKKAS